jgi:hypothetical protein
MHLKLWLVLNRSIVAIITELITANLSPRLSYPLTSQSIHLPKQVLIEIAIFCLARKLAKPSLNLLDSLDIQQIFAFKEYLSVVRCVTVYGLSQVF